MKNIFTIYLFLVSILFTACGPVDKSYNKDDKIKALICLNLQNTAKFTPSEKDFVFASCLLWVKKTHDSRVNSDGGLDCSKCHKPL